MLESKLLEKLTFEKAKEIGIKNIIQCVQYYFPELSDESADFVIWEKTCFPFDTDKTLDQLYEIYLAKQENK